MVKVWFIMKIFVLILIIILVLIIFNFINKSKLKAKDSNYSKDKTIDLEKDPKTNEYKPKEK